MHGLLLAAMTLADAISYALGHNSDVAQKQAAVSTAQSQYVKQRAQQLPTVAASLQNQASKSQNYLGSFSVIGAQQANVYSQNTAQIGTQYTLYNGGLNHILTLVAEQQLDQATTSLRQTQEQVASDVSDRFFVVASDDEATRLDRSDVAYQQVLVRIARAKVRVGVAAGVDVLRAQTQEKQSESTLVGAGATAQNDREQLAQRIGAPLDTAFAIPRRIEQPPLPRQPIDQLVALAQTNRPEVASAVEAMQIARLNRRSADSDLFPQVALNTAFGNQFSPTQYVQERQQVISENQSIAASNAFNARFGILPTPLLPLPGRGNPGFWLVGATTSISFPFIDWGARRANHANLDAQIAAAQTQLESQRGSVALDVRQNYRNAQAAVAQIRFAQEEVVSGLESARVARLQYENGIIGLSDVLQAQKTALSAETDLFNARVKYADAVVKLRLALGIYDVRSAVADIR